MIQLKEFLDSEYSLAIEEANAFLATLKDEDVVDVKYGSTVKKSVNGAEYQRTAILVLYRKPG